MIECEIQDMYNSPFANELEQIAYEQMIPIKGVFELTARCNFNCKMCYVHLSNNQANQIGRELSNEEWIKIAQEAKDAGLLYLTLTGGEVFTRPKFRELYEALSDMGFLIYIMSNGYLIDESVVEWLSKRPPLTVRFTLYGSNNDVYKAVTGIENGFDRVSHAVDLLQAAHIPVALIGMIIKENEHDLQNMYKYSFSKGIVFRHSIAVVNPVRGATANAKDSFIDITKRDKSEFESLKGHGPLFQHHTNWLDDCGHYRKGFWLTWDGNLGLCSFMEYPCVKVKGKGFVEAWYELNNQLETLQTPDKCKSCRYLSYCNSCPGVFMAENFNLKKPLKTFCEKAIFLYNMCNNDQNKEG